MRRVIKLFTILLIIFTLSSCKTKAPQKDPIEDNPIEEAPVEDDSAIKTCKHTYNNNECSSCGTIYDEYIFSLYGDNTIIYDNDDTNPYNIDLNLYGSDIRAIFYEPKLDENPYISVDKTSFYSNYKESTTYGDSYYRTKAKLISGDISKQSHIPNSFSLKENDSYIRCTTGTYVLDLSGNYIAYIPNDFNDTNNIIFYGGGYTSLNDVCAYIFAFGEVPSNSKYDKNNGKTTAVSDWGIYGRVNMDKFSGNTNKYPYEPKLPYIDSLRYTETDFGTIGGYKNYNSITGTLYTQKEYNNGYSISRGAARIVFVSDTSVKSIDQRYVFYTYNHYNDFQEYLNYNNGFGKRFGNESAGNEYCGSSNDYYQSAKYEPTQYPNVIYKSLYEMEAL